MRIDVDLDNRLRLICSVLLTTDWADVSAAGPDGQRWKWHPIKRRVYDHVQAFRDHRAAVITRERYAEIGAGPFITLAMMLGETSGQWVIESDARETVARYGWPAEAVDGLELMSSDDYVATLTVFQRDASLPALWEEMANDWERVLDECRAVLDQRAIADSVQLIFRADTLDLRLVPAPELPVTNGYGPRDRHRAYCCLGPPNVAEDDPQEVSFLVCRDRSPDIIFHEFAHSLWADMRRHAPDIDQRLAPLQKKIHLKGYLAADPSPWPFLLDEIMTRVATVLHIEHVDGPEAAAKQIQHEHDTYGLTCVGPACNIWRNLILGDSDATRSPDKFMHAFVDRLVADLDL